MEIFTIGHSTHSCEEFISMLKSFEIKTLVDVRSYPGSRHVPQFNKENMAQWVVLADIEYLHMPQLGGRRRKMPEIDDRLVEGWNHIAFKNYAAYTLTQEYQEGLNELAKIVRRTKTCIMCAESVPWKCHRLLISNSLAFEGFCVRHILEENKSVTHQINKYGAKAVFDGKKVIYPKS